MSKNSNLHKYRKKRTSKSFKQKKSTKKKIDEKQKKEKQDKNEKLEKSKKTPTDKQKKPIKLYFFEKYKKYLPFLILVIVIIVFSNSINNDFLNWDDDRYVTGNQNLDFTWENIKYYFTNFYFVMYIPLTMISYMIDLFIGGGNFNPVIFHTHNLILHLINTLLVFFIIKELFKKQKKTKYIYAFFTALLFGIHPMHVESVSWIAERKDVLYSVFFFASILSYLKYTYKKKNKYFIFSLIFFLLSLLSKTQAVVLPGILFLIDYLNRNFLDNKESLQKFISLKDKNQWKLIVEKTPFIILSGIFAYIAIKASGTNEPFAETINTETKIAVDTGYNLFESIVLMSYSLFLYFAKMIIPLKQSAIHPYPFEREKMPFEFLFFVIFPVIYIATLIWTWIKQKKLIVFSLLFFLGNLIIVLRIKNFIISEHYLYVPAIGVSLILIFIFLNIINKNRKLKGVILIFSLIYLIFLGLKTFQRNKIFENSLTFWNDVSAKYPEVIVSYYNRGNYLQKKGDKLSFKDKDEAKKLYQEAIADYSETIRRHSTNTGAYSNRGITYAKIKNYKKAIKDFDKVIKIDSNYGNVYSNRGNIFALLGKWDKAIADYNKSIKLKPENPDAFFNRGVAYSNINKHKKAIKDFNTVLEYSSDKINAYKQLGFSYYYLAQYRKAINNLNIYLKLKPKGYNAIYYRALSFEKISKNDSAKIDFQTLKNNYPQIINDIIKTANSYEVNADRSGNIQLYEKAIKLFNDILKIDAENSVAYMRIGVVYGKMNNLSKAFHYLDKAIDLNPQNAEAYIDRGYAYTLKNKYTKAMEDYNKAISIDSEKEAAFYNRSLVYVHYGNFEKALEDLNKAISINSNYAIAYNQRGIVYLKLNNVQKACADWKKASSAGLEQATKYLTTYCK